MSEYKYGMRLRGFSPGCQPKEGFVEREDDPSGRYYDILVYNRKLTDDELLDYELDELNEKAMAKAKIYVYNIEWDIDSEGNEVPDLPDKVIIDNISEEDAKEAKENICFLDEYLADMLSDIYGWCVCEFNAEVIEHEED